ISCVSTPSRLYHSTSLQDEYNADSREGTTTRAVPLRFKVCWILRSMDWFPSGSGRMATLQQNAKSVFGRSKSFSVRSIRIRVTLGCPDSLAMSSKFWEMSTATTSLNAGARYGNDLPVPHPKSVALCLGFACFFKYF